MPTLSKDEARRRRAEKYAKFSPAGCCANCGAIEDLQWDHIDRSTKVMSVKEMCVRLFSDARIEAEIAKCQVLCGKCNNARARTVPQDVIDKILASLLRNCEVAELYGVSQPFVSRVRSGKRRSRRVTV